MSKFPAARTHRDAIRIQKVYDHLGEFTKVFTVQRLVHVDATGLQEIQHIKVRATNVGEAKRLADDEKAHREQKAGWKG